MLSCGLGGIGLWKAGVPAGEALPFNGVLYICCGIGDLRSKLIPAIWLESWLAVGWS